MIPRRSPSVARPRLVASFALALASLAPQLATAAAPTRPLDEVLTIDPGATCLDRAELGDHLTSWRAEQDVDPRIRVRVFGDETRRDRMGFSLRFDGELIVEREFDPAPPACADLHAVLALAIAIALDDTLASELGIVDPPQPATHSPVVAGPWDLPPKDAPPPEPGDRPRPRLGLTLAIGTLIGVLPDLSPGGLLSFDVRPLPRFDVRVAAVAGFAGDVTVGNGSASLSVAAGRVDLCWGTLPRRIRLRVCGGFAGGAVVAQGLDFTQNKREVLPWFAGLAGVDLVVALAGSAALELRVEGVIPTQHLRLDERGSNQELVASREFPVAGAAIFVGPRFEF